MEEFWDNLIRFFATASADIALRILGAVVITFVGFKVIKLVMRMLDKPLQKSKLDKGIVSFMENTLSILLRFILIISVLMFLGVPAASFIAVLSSIGLAVGLALQGSFSNFAGGLTILFFRTFRVGDFIKADTYEGTVHHISIMYTTLKTLDGKKVVIPNAMLSNGVVTDTSWFETRRVDVSFTTDFSQEIEPVRALLLEAAMNDPLVLKSPAPEATLDKIQDGLLVFTLRCWVKNADWWKTLINLTSAAKQKLSDTGIIARGTLREMRQV